MLVGCISVVSGAELVTDEATRLKVLAALFPGMSITATPDKHLDSSGQMLVGKIKIDLPDALKGEIVYRIPGAPRTQDEKCAAGDLFNEKESPVREVRGQFYSLSPSEYVAVTQYEFIGTRPSMACPSIAHIALVRQRAGVFTVADEFEADVTHHRGLQRVEMASLTGGTSEQLIVESDSGGAGLSESELFIFDISGEKLRPILRIGARVHYTIDKEEAVVNSLDVARTRSIKGARFCFASTTYVEDDKWFTPPRITHPCYKRGEGVRQQ